MLLQHRQLHLLCGILSSVVHIRRDLLWDLLLEGERKSEQKWIKYDPSCVQSAEYFKYLSDLMESSPTGGEGVRGDRAKRRFPPWKCKTDGKELWFWKRLIDFNLTDKFTYNKTVIIFHVDKTKADMIGTRQLWVDKTFIIINVILFNHEISTFFVLCSPSRTAYMQNTKPANKGNSCKVITFNVIYL